MNLRNVSSILVWIALGAGAFVPFYLQIHTADLPALRRTYEALPYRRIEGLYPVLLQVERLVPPGSEVLLLLPYTDWGGGYRYGFLRAEYYLADRRVLPMVNNRSLLMVENFERARYVACVSRAGAPDSCPIPPTFSVLWQGREGLVARRN